MINEHEITIPHFVVRDYNAIRQQYLASLPPGPTVDGQKAYQLRDFLGTPMGSTILNYFNSLTVQPNGARGLNRYGLNDANFRLWMAMKILAGPDTNMYARSIAADKDLFTEFVDKTSSQ
jgi:hypothetical protein